MRTRRAAGREVLLISLYFLKAGHAVTGGRMGIPTFAVADDFVGTILVDAFTEASTRSAIAPSALDL